MRPLLPVGLLTHGAGERLSPGQLDFDISLMSVKEIFSNTLYNDLVKRHGSVIPCWVFFREEAL